MKGQKIRGYLHSRDKEGYHRPEAIGYAEILVPESDGANTSIVRTEEGIVCKALFNCFAGMWFIDDVYAIVPEPEGM